MQEGGKTPFVVFKRCEGRTDSDVQEEVCVCATRTMFVGILVGVSEARSTRVRRAVIYYLPLSEGKTEGAGGAVYISLEDGVPRSSCHMQVTCRCRSLVIM